MPIALTTSAGVREILNSQFNPQDVEDALTFAGRSNFLKTKQENYENSSSCWTKFKDFIGIKGSKDNITEQWNTRANNLEKIKTIACALSKKEDDISEDNSSILVKTEENNQEYYHGDTTISDSIYYDADNNSAVQTTGKMWEAADAG